jgi:small subunit ribosomal protein S6
MRKYELMLILPAEADDKVVATVTDRVGQVLSGSGGEVGKVDRWGRRRFAYELDRMTEGFYVVAELSADPASLTELERVLTLADEVIRFKILVLPEKVARAVGERKTERAGREAAAPAEPSTSEPEALAGSEAAAATGAA